MNNILIEQNSRYALGNFIMLTPSLKWLSEKYKSKIDVYFSTQYVKDCFLDCDFINHVDKIDREVSFSSKMFNYDIPDYKNNFKLITKEEWTDSYHTYVDTANEYPKSNEDYILLLNGLGGLSLNENDPKPYWYGKKEIPEKIFRFIKQNTNLPIYFTGSESDMKQNPWMGEICDVIEIGNIRKSLSLVRDAKKIISNDTGLAHCASAMNKSILILWKDTPFVKNQNPGINSIYSQKNNWEHDIMQYL